MATRGSPPKLTPEIQKIICDAIAEGVPQSVAATQAGVTERTMINWMNRGKKAVQEATTGLIAQAYRSFFSAVKKARADCVAERVKRIGKAGQGGAVVERITTTDKSGNVSVKEKVSRPEWTADAWYLERQLPDMFGNDRREMAELKKMVKELMERLDGKGAT